VRSAGAVIRRPPDLATSVLLVVGAFAAGYLGVAVAAAFGSAGPLLLAVLAMSPLLAMAVFNDPRVGVALVVASFPIGVMSVPGAPVQLVQLLTLIVAALVALRRLTDGHAPLPLPSTMVLPVAFCAWLVVALPSSIDHQRSLRELGLFVIGVVVALVVVASARSFRDVALILAVVVGVLATISAFVPFMTGDLQASFGASVVRGRATGVFDQPNQLGTAALTGSLLALGFAFAKSGRARWFATAAAGACALALVLSLSRGAWIGFAVGVAVLLVKLPEARRTVLLATLPVLAAAFLVGAFVPSSPQAEIVGERLRSIAGEKNPYDDRPTLWREAIREISNDPLTGEGPGTFPVASTRSTSKSRTVFAHHAHNLLLNWGAENGLPAAAIAVGFGLVAHSILRREGMRARPHDRAIVAGLAAALAALAAQGTVDYTYRNSVLMTLLFVLLGAVVAIEWVGRRP